MRNASDFIIMRAVRPRRPLDDEFFINGDELSLYDPSSHVIFCIEESIYVHSMASSQSDALKHLDVGDKDNLENPILMEKIHDMNRSDHIKTMCNSLFPCPIHSCHEYFQSISEFQSHYELTHIYQCSVCRLVLPSDYLLDLHIQEKHDSYFHTALERGKAFYQCLSSSCAITFDHESDRNQHLQQIHGYPKWFRFYPKAFEESKQRKSSSKRKTKTPSILEYEKHQWRQKYLEEGKKNTVNGSHDTDRVSVSHCVSKERNERRKLKNSTIPCKYHMNGGCWRGSRCMFLHTDVVAHTKNPSLGEDREVMDDLSKRLQSATTFRGRKPRIHL